MVLDEPRFGERLRKVLEPFGASFSGSLGRGDLVIPEHEIERLVREILGASRRKNKTTCRCISSSSSSPRPGVPGPCRTRTSASAHAFAFEIAGAEAA